MAAIGQVAAVALLRLSVYLSPQHKDRPQQGDLDGWMATLTRTVAAHLPV